MSNFFVTKLPPTLEEILPLIFVFSSVENEGLSFFFLSFFNFKYTFVLKLELSIDTFSFSIDTFSFSIDIFIFAFDLSNHRIILKLFLSTSKLEHLIHQ
jgi:hypothetical protein